MKIKILAAALLVMWTVAAQAQRGESPRGGDPTQRAEMQTKMMVDSLSLSNKQGEKVKDINLKYANKQKEMRQANAEGDWEQMRTKMTALRTEQDTELKTLLTQEQYDRWQKIAAEQFQRRGGPNGGDGKGQKGKKGSPPPPPPPPPTPETSGGN